jgi:hypothetical protein
VKIDSTQLAMLLGGISLCHVKRRKRYAIPEARKQVDAA